MGSALLGGAERHKNLRRRIESSQGAASVCLGRERETSVWNQCEMSTCGRLVARRPGRDRRRDRARRRQSVRKQRVQRPSVLPRPIPRPRPGSSAPQRIQPDLSTVSRLDYSFPCLTNATAVSLMTSRCVRVCACGGCTSNLNGGMYACVERRRAVPGRQRLIAPSCW